MKKEQKKEFELQIINSIEKLLSSHDAKAAEKVKRHIKDAGKTVAKKFYKAAKSNAEQVARIAKTASKTPVKKTTVAVAAVTTKTAGTKKTPVKKARPAKRKSK